LETTSFPAVDGPAIGICTAWQRNTTPIDDLQLKALQLMDDAVRGGGLGPLLQRYLHMLLVSLLNGFLVACREER